MGRHGPDTGPIATFVRLDLIGAVGGLAALVVLNGFIVRAGAVWVIAPFLIVLIVSLTVADLRLRAGDVGVALVLTTAANWLVAAVVAAVLPFLWPVMAITVLMPLVLATPYLRPRNLAMALGTGAVIAGAIAVLGLLNDDGGAVPDIDDDFELVLVVGALMAQMLPVTLIAWQNNDLQRRALARSMALNRELRASELQLAGSRRRVVEAGDTERRRIERDLHDGAQQRLVALGVRLRLLEDRVATDPELAPAVRDLVGELEGAVDEIRELAQGIYPPLLRSRGLVAALRAVARRSPSPVETELAPIERPDPSIEAALYFTALEALANAAKHAPGAEVTLRLVAADDRVVLTVEDRGPGFRVGEVARSQGIGNMEDRLATVGGHLVVDSAPGRGTTVVATVVAGRAR
jgi:signal transduction histidine kinase